VSKGFVGTNTVRTMYMMNEAGMSPLTSSKDHADDTEEDASGPMIVAGKHCILICSVASSVQDWAGWGQRASLRSRQLETHPILLDEYCV